MQVYTAVMRTADRRNEEGERDIAVQAVEAGGFWLLPNNNGL